MFDQHKAVGVAAIVCVLLAIGAYMYLSDRKKASPTHSEGFQNEVEYLSPQPEYEDLAQELGIGMGPGLYGSGRHTSEMIGN